jgi:hypothetical protein
LRPVKPAVRGDVRSARRRHLSPGTRAALGRTRFIEIVPAGPSRVHASAPPLHDEPPVVLHPLWAPVHARRSDGIDIRPPARRAHALHPATPPRHGTRPGRRPRPIVPFDIPVEAYAVEVGGSAHPVVRRLGDRRLVYVEHRRAVRRSYRRRQLALAVGLSSAFVAVAATALAPGGHASAAAPAAVSGTAAPVVPAAAAAPPSGAGPLPAYDRARGITPVTAGPRLTAEHRPDDRDERHVPIPPWGKGSIADNPFLICTKGYESIDAGGYHAIGDGGRYRGAYQFDQVTWNGVADHVGHEEWVGVLPDEAPPAVQDYFALTLYKWQGARHWNGRCAGLP